MIVCFVVIIINHRNCPFFKPCSLKCAQFSGRYLKTLHCIPLMKSFASLSCLSRRNEMKPDEVAPSGSKDGVVFIFQTEITSRKCFWVKSPIFSQKSLFRLRLHYAAASCLATFVSWQFTLPPPLKELWRDKQNGWIFVRTDFHIPFDQFW